MKITILGSGTILASATRTTPAYLLEQGNKKYLIDTGPDILHQLARNTTNITDINGIFYTHLHTDHIDGLMPFLVSLFVTGMFKKLFEQEELSPSLSLFGPQQFNAFFDKLHAVHGNFLQDFLAYVPRQEFGDGNATLVDGIHILAKHVEHTENSIGYRVSHNNKTVVFSGDSGLCDGLIALAEDADVAIFECSTPTAIEVPDHLSPRKCGQIATQANVKKLVLSHIYPQTESFPLVDECKQHFAGDVALGFDGMIIEV